MNKKSNEGITLIALVVTIIVLLILAGVSIAMLTGKNGILNRASEAEYANTIKRVDEEVKLAQIALKAHITSNMVSKAGYLATKTDTISELATEVATELKAVTGKNSTTVGTMTSGTAADISAERYTVTYYLDEAGSATVNGDGYIVIWYTDNTFRSSIKVEDAIDTYGLLGSKTLSRNQATLAYIIHVTNYDCALSDEMLTTTADANTDLGKGNCASTSLYTLATGTTAQHKDYITLAD